MKFGKRCFSFLFFFTLSSLTAFAQDHQIEIVFDASRSMNDKMESGLTRLEEAKKALRIVASQIEPGANVGLRIFGKNPVQGNVRESCFDSKLEIPIQPYNAQAMLNEVANLAAHGQTALGYSLELAGQDFSPDPQVKKTVILISDGEESCGKDPINVVGGLKARGINYVVHAVGFGVDAKTKAQLQQITNMTGGTYQDAQSGVQLQESLQKVAIQAQIADPAKIQAEKPALQAVTPKSVSENSQLPAEEEEKTLLLQAQKSKGENILSAVAGARIVFASDQSVGSVIDGAEEDHVDMGNGEYVVFSFKDNQPVLIDSFSTLIEKESDSNPKTIFLSGSLENSKTGFFPIKTATFSNKTDYKDLYQTVKIDPPVAVRYLKVTSGETVNGGDYIYHYEWRVTGKFLTETEYQAKISESKSMEFNLIAQDAGGQLVASTTEGTVILNDGISFATAPSRSVDAGTELIYAFQGEQMAYLTKFATPVYSASEYNCRTFEISVSETDVSGEFTPVGQLTTTNMVLRGQAFQEFAFEKPVKAKYVKIKVVDDHGDNGYCELNEVQILGTFQPTVDGAQSSANQAARAVVSVEPKKESQVPMIPVETPASETPQTEAAPKEVEEIKPAAEQETSEQSVPDADLSEDEFFKKNIPEAEAKNFYKDFETQESASQ